MKKIIIVLLILLPAISCEKTEKVCNCDNPLQDLTWLKELKSSLTDCSCQISIFQATYDKQTVFYTLMNDPVCNGYLEISLLDCAGASLKTYTRTDESFSTEVTGRKVIYTCTQ